MYKNYHLITAILFILSFSILVGTFSIGMRLVEAVKMMIDFTGSKDSEYQEKLNHISKMSLGLGMILGICLSVAIYLFFFGVYRFRIAGISRVINR